jgi:hypothetical protein
MAESVAPHARPHYAWAVAAVTFVTLLATAGVRATPGVLIVPLERELGWSRGTIAAWTTAHPTWLSPRTGDYAAAFHAAGALCLLAAALAIGRRGPARNRWNVTGATATTA